MTQNDLWKVSNFVQHIFTLNFNVGAIWSFKDYILHLILTLLLKVNIFDKYYFEASSSFEHLGIEPALWLAGHVWF